MEHPHAKFGLKLIVTSIFMEIGFAMLGGIFAIVIPNPVIYSLVISIGFLLASVLQLIGFYRVSIESIGFRTAFHFQISVIVARVVIAIINFIGTQANIPWLQWTQSSIDWLVVIISIIMFWFIVRGCYEITGEKRILHLAHITFGLLIGGDVLSLACKIFVAFQIAEDALSAIGALSATAAGILYIVLLIKTYKEVN